MAATMTRVVTLTTSYCCRHFPRIVCKSSPATQTLLRNSSTQPTNEESETESLFTDYEEMEEEERIEQLRVSLRDISGLTEPQKRRFRGQMPEIKNDYQQSVRYHRKLYGKLGAESGVDPRLSWTGRQKALELAQLYREWQPPLEERLARLKEEKEKKAAMGQMREKKIQENMAKMDQWIADYKQRLAKKDAEALQKEEKKRKVLEEAREYFGYYVDPRDSKFQEMIEEKEKQEKLLAKKQKKEKKLEKLAARLQHLAQDAGNK